MIICDRGQIPKMADETFDIGVDTRTGINDKDYQVPFAFDGKIATSTRREPLWKCTTGYCGRKINPAAAHCSGADLHLKEVAARLLDRTSG